MLRVTLRPLFVVFVDRGAHFPEAAAARVHITRDPSAHYTCADKRVFVLFI